MPAKSLAEKMKLKPGQRAVIVNAPEGFVETLGPLPEGVQLAEKLAGQFDWIQIFVKNKAELDKLAPRVVKALKPVSILWVTFPKGTSKIQTDLTRDKGWDSLSESGLKWITLVSVNDTWSAFSMRPPKPGEDVRHHFGV